jgi:hypothetical protein
MVTKSAYRNENAPLSRFLRRKSVWLQGRSRANVGLFMTALAGLSLISAPQASAAAKDADSPLAPWDFKFKDFVIGAWLGPVGTDAEVRVYKEAGFNVVMVGRYMAVEQYALPENVAKELDLARKHHLGAMIDTYTQNDKPWGGIATPYAGSTGHHNATLEELKWLHGKFGDHPAVIGYMLGDDQGTMGKQLAEGTEFLRKNAPHLMPWVCGWVPAKELAAHKNPFVNWQIYPTLYNTAAAADEQAQQYCASYSAMRRDCLQYGLVGWPMFNVTEMGHEKQSVLNVTDSLLRFPIYAALAYGAQGIWYFTYRDYGALHTTKELKKGRETLEAARAGRTAKYFVAQQANRRVAAYGPRLLGAASEGLFSTGWQIRGAVGPMHHKIVEGMSENLLVGILTKPDRPPMAMVVSKRVTKGPGKIPPEAVEVQFSDLVKSIRIVREGRDRTVRGNTARLALAGGEGLLLELEARRKDRPKLRALASSEEIHASYAPLIDTPVRWFGDRIEVRLKSPVEDAGIRYTLDGSVPGPDSKRYVGKITLTQSARVRAVSDAPGMKCGGYEAAVSLIRSSGDDADHLAPLEGFDLVARYRMGEDDPGARDGVPGNATTQAWGREGRWGGKSPDLKRKGAPTISTDAAAAIGSMLSVRFQAADGGDLYFLDDALTTVTDNFAIEAWVKPTQTERVCQIVYNGNPSTSGFGLHQAKDKWAGLFGGVTFITGAPVRTDQWTHLALVCEQGLTSLYVNGAQAAGPVTAKPNPAAGAFTIGGPQEGKNQSFDGLIDEVRVFTFEPGLFGMCQ